MANDFIPDLDCASPFIAIDAPDENCPDSGDLSEVKYILLADSATLTPAQVSTLLPDWTDSADWAAAIDNAAVDGSKIKQLLVIGNVTTAEPSTRQMPAHKVSYGEAVSTLTATVKTVPDNLYSFLNKMRVSSALPYLWFVTVGGKMFGSPTGIELDSKNIPFALAEGLDSYEEYQIIFTWKAKAAPLRIDSPI